MVSIGKAGENKIYYASIEQGRSSASRGGVGAVMGDKKVKAIVVRGTGDINIAQPAEYLQECNEVLDYIKWREDNPIPGVIPILAVLGSPQEMAIHDEKWHTENFSWGNARVRQRDFWTEEIAKEWHDTLESARTRLISCYNCPMKCGATLSLPWPERVRLRVDLADVLRHMPTWKSETLGDLPSGLYSLRVHLTGDATVYALKFSDPA